jgi:hypothetical protein
MFGNVEQKFIQNVMRLFMIDCSKMFIMCYNTFYSLHPALWFLSVPQKNPRGTFKDRRVAVYR